MALAYLQRAPIADTPYLRFLSWIGTPAGELAARQRVMRFWLNSLSQEPDLEFPGEVPGSAGLLWVIDLRDYGWNVTAFARVARREPYFREPWIKTETAAALRAYLYITQDQVSFHADAIVRADWLFRETAETDRSSSYYDLLFARQRFGDKAWWAGGQNYSKGWYYTGGGNTGGRVDPNFPKDERQWEQFFGADVVLNYLRKQKVRVQHGAIVEQGVSIVARQNRLLIRTPVPAGYYWVTKDVTETAGRKDFAETLIFDFQHDASEYIATLPNGGQAYLLSNGEGKRVETADPKVAIDSTDPADRRVRTPGSCVVCHAGGINRPTNLVEQFVKDGLDIRFRDKSKLREVRAFFLGWDRKLKQDQESYAEFVQKGNGETDPEKNATVFKRWRDGYDAPVGLIQACAETGMTQQQFVTVANASPHARLLMLARGRTIPRRAWEVDTFKEAMLISVARK